MFYPEFSFNLPKGFIDSNHQIHRLGKMRATTAKDEIIVQQNSQVQEFSEYGILVMLSRVITNLGNISQVTPTLLEQLLLVDFMYLQDIYYQINQLGGDWLTEGEL
ncbi:phage tail assembly protein [Anabaena sp. UHCC 0204]|uniref:phage tail assembly protein n=1 Tax=Anabaena sp. UHCC 0204 TaxID=2590009 RepID=UPI001444A9CE|nr:phage tail assembly protein [Anabaena sp. UHCC 0204]MTJ10510.1 phage tail assembly protein [Anabaena sp. UHCC 0204]